MKNTTKDFQEVVPEINQVGNYMLRHLVTKENPQPFKLDKLRTEKYKLVFDYFTGNPEFTSQGYSFSKALMICGSVGTGKTLMMRIFAHLFMDEFKRPIFEVRDANEIVREFLIEGFVVLDRYSRKHFFEKKNAPKGLCIDDLGMENNKVKSFANEANVIADIISSRYKLMHECGMKTFATTNCPPDQLENLYGERVSDRMNEMFNIIVLNGKSLRK